MAEDVKMNPHWSKQERYEHLLKQVDSLIDPEVDWVANIANIIAVLKSAFPWLWVGVYRVSEAELVLGPFQGPLACTRIAFGRGVCGMAWQTAKSIIVQDVDQFPGHIACSALSRSEIVVPIFLGDDVIGVIDIDSEDLAAFDEIDQQNLEKVAVIIGDILDR